MAMPNGMTLEWGYEEKRDLVATMVYKRGATRVVEREYAYDSLARPVTRRTARQGNTVNDSFTYNSRSELTAATVNGKAYGYSYDNIGNRKTAQEDAEEATAYTANQLNQYTAIRQEDGEEETFIPTYDADGNQTRIKTATGIWNVTYNAENRPVRFESADGSTVVECTYDYMGRRHTRKVTVNGTVSNYLRYIYRGYLQIAAIDAVSGVFRWFLFWDPTQPEATRPLAIRKDGTWYAYGWDLTKNVTEVFGPAGYIRTTYTYTPYGEATATGDVTQPFTWSSEYADEELGLIYYNYRHYNSTDGRWINRDPIAEQGGWNLYAFVNNNGMINFDYLGKGYLARRPLAHTAFTHDGKKYYTIHGHVYKAEGLSIQHSHFFFDDETNIGYFPDGLHEDNSEGEERKLYIKIRDNLDDCILREAIKKTPPKPYSLTRFTIKVVFEEQSTLYQVNNMGQIIPVPLSRNVIKIIQVINPDTDNCNSWALRVLKKYDELVKKIKK